MKKKLARKKTSLHPSFHKKGQAENDRQFYFGERDKIRRFHALDIEIISFVVVE